MSKIDLRTIKKEHLEFLKAIRARKGVDAKINSKLYLDSCIRLIEQELYPDKKHMNRTIGFNFDRNISNELRATGMFEDAECDVIAVLLSNDRPIAVGDLAFIAQMDRGKAYRTIESLLEYGMIVKLGVDIKSLYLIGSKRDPLKPMIDYITNKAKNEVEKLSKFQMEKISV